MLIAFTLMRLLFTSIYYKDTVSSAMYPECPRKTGEANLAG